MRKLLPIIIVLLFSVLGLAQTTMTSGGIGPFNPGAPPQQCPVSFTANGAGTGSMVDNYSPQQINFSYNGSSTSGSTSGNYTCGAIVTFTPSSTGGSSFSWGSNTLGCSGTGQCSAVLTSTSGYTAVAHWSPSGGGGTIPSTDFGLGINAGFPTVSFGLMRDWDTCGAEWPYIAGCNAASCTANDTNLVYNYTTGCNANSGFDTWSLDAASAGVKATQVTLGSRTPSFATSAPTDSSCSYCSSGGSSCKVAAGRSNGQCDAPSDLPANGQNGNSCAVMSTEQCNLYLRYWIKNFGQHVTNGTWLNTHASVNYVEPMNEPDSPNFAKHTYDQQGRITADIAQLYVGDANWHITLSAVDANCKYTVSTWNTNPSGASGTYQSSGYYAGYHVNTTGMGISGNNVTNATVTASTSTSMTLSTCAHSAETHPGDALIVNTYTGETAAQTQATVGLSGPINSSALILTGSYHPQNFNTSLSKMICELYCSGSSCNASGNSCTTGGSAFFYEDINVHVKQGNDTPTTLENDTDNSNTNLTNALDAPEQAKPIVAPEAAYSSNGWNDDGCDPVASCGPPYTNYTDAGMEASFIIREYVYAACKGWVSTTWYNWKGTLGTTLTNNAYTALYNYLLGITQPSCTTSNPGTAGGTNSSGNAVHTYTATFTDANGVASAFIWDNSQYCTGNSASATSAQCVATTQTVGSTYLHWVPLVNMTIGGTNYTAGTPVSISSHQMPVSIIPVKLTTN